MSNIRLRKQFITDADGNKIGVIMPIEDLVLVEPILRRHEQTEDEKLHQMEQAAQDPLFLADLNEAMSNFEHTDREWWEHKHFFLTFT